MTEEQETRQITVPHDAAVIILGNGRGILDLPEGEKDQRKRSDDPCIELAKAIIVTIRHDEEMTRQIIERGRTAYSIFCDAIAWKEECDDKQERQDQNVAEGETGE